MWDYFLFDGNDASKVFCGECLKTKGRIAINSATSSLSKHLLRQHKINIKDSSDSKKTLQFSLDKPKKISQKKFQCASFSLIMFLLTNHLPQTAFNNRHLRNFCDTLGFECPGRRLISKYQGKLMHYRFGPVAFRHPRFSDEGPKRYGAETLA